MSRVPENPNTINDLRGAYLDAWESINQLRALFACIARGEPREIDDSPSEEMVCAMAKLGEQTARVAIDALDTFDNLANRLIDGAQKKGEGDEKSQRVNEKRLRAMRRILESPDNYIDTLVTLLDEHGGIKVEGK